MKFALGKSILSVAIHEEGQSYVQMFGWRDAEDLTKFDEGQKIWAPAISLDWCGQFPGTMILGMNTQRKEDEPEATSIRVFALIGEILEEVKLESEP